MARESKLVDPVAEDHGKQEQADQAAALSIDALTLDDFKPVPVTAARQPHPFEGYPQKRIKIGTYKKGGRDVDFIVNATHIVALNPKEYVHQDPSGKGVTIQHEGQEKVVDYVTSHSRIVRNDAGRNEIVVFDREITLGGGATLTRCAICPDHTARAQIVFKVDRKTGKIDVDRRYVLADIDQVGRLRRLFEMFNYQQTQSERMAQRFDAEPESATG